MGRLKPDQNIRLFWCMSHQMRRVGVVPACNLNQPTCQAVLVQRLDYRQAAVIDEERVVAKYLPEFRKRRVTSGITSASIWSKTVPSFSELSFITGSLDGPIFPSSWFDDRNHTATRDPKSRFRGVQRSKGLYMFRAAPT